MKNLITLALILSALPGCTQFVDNSTIAFYKSDFQANGKIAVLPADSSLNTSLEFQHYKRIVESHLEQAGYAITSSFAEADSLAFLSYGIDTGTDKTVPVPIYGQTGGGTTTNISGTIQTSGTGQATGYGSTSHISGTTYTMPTYGIVGVGSATSRTYKRALALDVYDLNGDESEPGKVLEARTTSNGRCSNIYEVLDEMIEATFRDFPKKSGSMESVRVHGTFNC